MTRIGLISDTHGYLDDKVFKYFEQCDEIWHAGDFGNVEVSDRLSAFKILRGVYGNIDGIELRKIHPLDLHFETEGVSVFMTHIGGYPGRYESRVYKILKEKTPRIFVCGHSHILKVMRDNHFNGMLHLNPGAAGKEGFHKMRTLLRFAIDKGEIKDMEAIELGKRGALL